MTLRPSLEQFRGTLGARRRYAIGLIGAFVPVLIGYSAAVYFWSHGNLWVVFIAPVIVLAFATALLARALLHLACVRLDVFDQVVVRHGFPFRRYSSGSVAAVEQLTVEFLYGVTATAWVLLDARRNGQGWLTDDFWAGEQVNELAGSLGVQVRNIGTRMKRADLLESYGRTCQSWGLD